LGTIKAFSRLPDLLSKKSGWNMKDLKLVIFDMDGLMFDTEEVSYRCFKEATQLYGQLLTRDVFKEILGVNIARAKIVYEKHFGEDFPFGQMVEKKLEFAANYIRDNGVPIKPGLYELIDFLEKNGIKKIVATSSHRDVAANLIERAGLTDKIDNMICGDEVEKSKPDPEIFLKAAEKMQVKTEHALVLEDSLQGILAAHRARIKSIMIPDMVQADDKTKQLYFAEKEDLNEVKYYLERNFLLG